MVTLPPQEGDVAKRATLLSRTTSFIYTLSNRPLPSPKYLHFQNEATCTIFLVKMSFSWMRMKNHFNKKGWVLEWQGSIASHWIPYIDKIATGIATTKPEMQGNIILLENYITTLLFSGCIWISQYWPTLLFSET